MSAEFPALAAVVRQHRLVTYLDKSSGSLWIGSWPTRYRCECGWVSDESDCTRTDHPEHVESAWREVCTVRTVEQLDGLPDHAIVRSSTDGHAYEKSMLFTMAGRRWWEAGNGSPVRSADIGLPALLIWHPDWAKS